MGLGDELLAAGHAQRVYDETTSRRVAICDLQGKARWHPLWDGNPIIAPPDRVERGEKVHRIQNASGCRPYVKYPFTRDTGWTYTDWRARDHRGRIYLTAEERQWASRVREAIGPFVLIEPSAKRVASPNKSWPFERYAQLVHQTQDVVRFVRFMHEDPRPLPGVTHKTAPTFRHAIALLSRATAYVGTEGALHHAAAVVGIPAVVIFGGSIPVDNLGYPEHVNLADDGPGSPCGRWLPCDHCRRAMDRITVDRVVDSLMAVLERAHVERSA